MKSPHYEPLSPSLQILVSDTHHFTTDTFLLAHFSAPKHKERCCEFGTGCGTIPLLWAERYQPKEIVAVELQAEAVALAKQSVAENGFSSQITVLQEDLRQMPALYPEYFHRIACNPPYKEIGTGLQNPEMGKAIARHECETTLQEILQSGFRCLRYGGVFCLCLRPQRLAETLSLMHTVGLEPKRLQLVQQRSHTPPHLFLVEGKKGGKVGLAVLPTLLIETPDGQLTDAMREIYGTYKGANQP